MLANDHHAKVRCDPPFIAGDVVRHRNGGTVNERHLQILRHSLGLNYEGRGRQYRNHFCAGGDDLQSCEELVASGHMARLRVSAMLTGGDPAFCVTELGKVEAVKGVVRLSRSKQRYMRYLRSNCDMSFGEWLKGGYA